MNDFIEILNFCGYDVQQADKMAKAYPPITYTPELMQEVLEESGLG